MKKTSPTKKASQAGRLAPTAHPRGSTDGAAVAGKAASDQRKAPAKRAKTARRGVMAVEPLRFANGLRTVGDELANRWTSPVHPDDPTIVVDLVRPADLVALSVEAVGCELVTGGATPPVLRPIAGHDARLVVRYPTQHLIEHAIYESPAKIPSEPTSGQPPIPVSDSTRVVDGLDARPDPPIEARPARSSRLVFAVPADESIEFSTSGVLSAMGRLQMLVHPLAKPADEPSPAALGEAPVILLPGGLVAHLLNDVPVIQPATARTATPDPSTAGGAVVQSQELRRARTILATSAASSLLKTSPVTDAATLAPTVDIAGQSSDLRPIFGDGGLIGDGAGRYRRPRRPRRPTLSSRPTDDQTSIEAPFRVVISPSDEARWAHADDPVRAGDEPHHVELWHSRLGTAATTPDGAPTVEERDDHRRIIRAVWDRDRETSVDDWHDPTKNLGHFDTAPFRASLDPADRNMLVRQTAETWLDHVGQPIDPIPAAAKKLWLSGLGAWLDLHGAWDTPRYSGAGMSAILAWDHVAPMGRDQYVRVVYPGFLYPFGHRAALVKLTERKIKDPASKPDPDDPGTPQAGLYQRMFLVIGERRRTYRDAHRLPLIQVDVRPLVTPTLDDPPPGAEDSMFWPMVGGVPFAFTLDTFDQDIRPARLHPPLLWVAEAYGELAHIDAEYDRSPHRVIATFGQKIAFGPVRKGGDTVLETESIALRGNAVHDPSTNATTVDPPHMSQAKVRLPAVQQLSGIGAVPVGYASIYKTNGFGGPNNPGDVWAEIATNGATEIELADDGTNPTPDVDIALPQLRFGAGAPSGSDKAGGFLSPDLPIRGLSRSSGTVGDLAGMAKQTFDPVAFLQGALPKLFGIVSLVDLVEAVTGDILKTPSVLSEGLQRIEGFIADLQHAEQAATDAVDEAHRMVDRAAAKTAQLQAEASAAVTAAMALQSDVRDAASALITLLTGLAGQDKSTFEAALTGPLGALRSAVQKIRDIVPTLPPLVSSQLATLAKVLDDVLRALDDAKAMIELIEEIYRFANGLDGTSVQARFRFEWRPDLHPWPPGADPILDFAPDPVRHNVARPGSMVLAVEGRASGTGEMGVEVLAEIRDFSLNLVGSAKLVKIAFDHLSFKAGSSGKADVDVVIQKFEFVGFLSFVETIKDLIPFDGFSDPPYLDVSPSGVVAGFTLALPSLSIGVFTLANMSLGADVQVPFLGKSVSVGFNFCTRERPFTLAVVFLGGGGWFGIRIGPDGLQLLEMGLEAGACLAVDLGVASGSISAMIGIYIRLEGTKGSLAGYFRLRGEVDVLGLISASIELYMELVYEFDTGKMIGRATITVQVKVLFFSGSVQISAERKFAGSDGDPTFLQVMGAESGTSPAWTEYCLAFGDV